MACGREGAAVPDLDQDPGAGPDAQRGEDVLDQTIGHPWGASGRNSVTIRRRPALRIGAGGPNRSSRARTAGCCNRRPNTRSNNGRICVSSPWSRFATRVV
ncbi:hypothetical protein GCM10023088_39930 [Actinomadura verrucosospora]